MVAIVQNLVTSGVFELDGGAWEVDNNVWILGDDTEVIVIDAAHNAKAIADVVGDRKLKAIVSTHAHNDHVNAAPDLAQLRAALAGEVPPASLDDHRGFVDRMRAMSSAAVAVGIGVVLLVFIATVLSVTFATRAAMATNRPVIEVLHLIGAKDNFIAGHFQRHFLQLGLKGGLIGGGSAIALFALAELAIGWFGGRADGNQFAALFGSFSIGALGYLAVLVQVALIAGVTALTSRRTVNHTIETIH